MNMRKAIARIAELEAAVREQQKALDLIYTRETTRIAELEGERDKWQQAAGDLFHSSHADNVKLAKLEAALDDMSIERGRAQEELREVLDNKHDRIAELEETAMARDRHIHTLDASIAQLEAMLLQVDQMRRDQARINADLTAHIAELEAERDRLRLALNECEGQPPPLDTVARIAELEADANLLVHLHALAIEQGYMPDPGESVYDLLQRAIMTGSPASAKARIAELEAERDKLQEAVVNAVWDRQLLAARIAELEARPNASHWLESRMAELEAKVAQYEADLEDPTLSVGEAYAWRSESHGPAKK